MKAQLVLFLVFIIGCFAQTQLTEGVPYDDYILPCTSKTYYVPATSNAGANEIDWWELEVTDIGAVTGLDWAFDITVYYGDVDDSDSWLYLTDDTVTNTNTELNLYCFFDTGLDYVIVVDAIGSTGSAAAEYTLEFNQYLVDYIDISIGVSNDEAGAYTHDGSLEDTPDYYQYYMLPTPQNTIGIDQVLTFTVSGVVEVRNVYIGAKFEALAVGDSAPIDCNDFYESGSVSDIADEVVLTIPACSLEYGYYIFSVSFDDDVSAGYEVIAEISGITVEDISLDANDMYYKDENLVHQDDFIYYRLDNNVADTDDYLVIEVVDVVNGNNVELEVYNDESSDPIHLGGQIFSDPDPDHDVTSCSNVFDSCSAAENDDCIIVIPYCDYTAQNWYFTLYDSNGPMDPSEPIRFGFKIQRINRQVQDIDLETDTTFFGQTEVGINQYTHYTVTFTSDYLEDPSNHDVAFNVLFYDPRDRYTAYVYMSKESFAGESGYCDYDNEWECQTNSEQRCHMRIQLCDLEAITYYFSVFNDNNDFETPLEISVHMSLDHAIELFDGVIINSHNYVYEYQHYFFDITDIYEPGMVLRYSIQDVYDYSHMGSAAVDFYMRYDDLAGECNPGCYLYDDHCLASQGSPGDNGCNSYVSFCEVQRGVYWFSTFPQDLPGFLQHETMVGYTLRVWLEAGVSATTVSYNEFINDELPDNDVLVPYHFVSGNNAEEALWINVVIHFEDSPDMSGVQVGMYLNEGSVAGDDSNCHMYQCIASIQNGTYSYCTIELQPCEYKSNTDYFVTLMEISGNEVVDTTLYITGVPITATALTDGVAEVSVIVEHSYRHFVFTTPATFGSETEMIVDLYIANVDTILDLYLNPGSRAGEDDHCFDYVSRCRTHPGDGSGVEGCQIIVPTCQLLANTDYYISVHFQNEQHVHAKYVDFTLTATLTDVTEVTVDEDSTPILGQVWEDEYALYHFDANSVSSDFYYTIELASIQQGNIDYYLTVDTFHGVCDPCFSTSNDLIETGSNTATGFSTDYFPCDGRYTDFYLVVKGSSQSDDEDPIIFYVRGYITAIAGGAEIDLADETDIGLDALQYKVYTFTDYDTVDTLTIDFYVNGAEADALLYYSWGSPAFPGCGTGVGDGTYNIDICGMPSSDGVTLYLTVQNLDNEAVDADDSYITIEIDGSSVGELTPGATLSNIDIASGETLYYTVNGNLPIDFENYVEIFADDASLTVYAGYGTSNVPLAGDDSCNACSISDTSGYIMASHCGYPDGNYEWTVSVYNPTAGTVTFDLEIVGGDITVTSDVEVITVADSGNAIDIDADEIVIMSYTIPSSIVNTANSYYWISVDTTVAWTLNFDPESDDDYPYIAGPLPSNVGQSGNIPTCYQYDDSDDDTYYGAPCCMTGGTYYYTFDNDGGGASTVTFTIMEVEGESVVEANGQDFTLEPFAAKTYAIPFDDSYVGIEIIVELVSDSTGGDCDTFYGGMNFIPGDMTDHDASSDLCHTAAQDQFSFTSDVRLLQFPPCAVSEGNTYYLTFNNTNDAGNTCVINVDYNVVDVVALSEGSADSYTIPATVENGIGRYVYYTFTVTGDEAFTPNLATELVVGAATATENVLVEISQGDFALTSADFITSIWNTCSGTSFDDDTAAEVTFDIVGPGLILADPCESGSILVSVRSQDTTVPGAADLVGAAEFTNTHDDYNSDTSTIRINSDVNSFILEANEVDNNDQYNVYYYFTLDLAEDEYLEYEFITDGSVGDLDAVNLEFALYSACECWDSQATTNADNTVYEEYYDPCDSLRGDYVLYTETTAVTGTDFEATYGFNVYVRTMVERDTLTAMYNRTSIVTTVLRDTIDYDVDDTDREWLYYTIDTGVFNRYEFSLEITASSSCGSLDWVFTQCLSVLSSTPAIGCCNINTNIDTTSMTGYDESSADFVGGVYYIAVHIEDETYFDNYEYDIPGGETETVPIGVTISVTLTPIVYVTVAPHEVYELIQGSLVTEAVIELDGESENTEVFIDYEQGNNPLFYYSVGEPIDTDSLGSYNSVLLNSASGREYINSAGSLCNSRQMYNGYNKIYIYSASDLTFAVRYDESRIPVFDSTGSETSHTFHQTIGNMYWSDMIQGPAIDDSNEQEVLESHIFKVLVDTDAVNFLLHAYLEIIDATIGDVLQLDVFNDYYNGVCSTMDSCTVDTFDTTCHLYNAECLFDCNQAFISVTHMGAPINEVQYKLHIYTIADVVELDNCVPLCDATLGDEIFNHYHLSGTYSFELATETALGFYDIDFTPAHPGDDVFAYYNRGGIVNDDHSSCSSTGMAYDDVIQCQDAGEDIYISIMSIANVATYEVQICENHVAPTPITLNSVQSEDAGTYYYSYAVDAGETVQGQLTVEDEGCSTPSGTVYLQIDKIPNDSGCSIDDGSYVDNGCYDDGTLYFMVVSDGAFDFVVVPYSEDVIVLDDSELNVEVETYVILSKTVTNLQTLYDTQLDIAVTNVRGGTVTVEYFIDQLCSDDDSGMTYHVDACDIDYDATYYVKITRASSECSSLGSVDPFVTVDVYATTSLEHPGSTSQTFGDTVFTLASGETGYYTYDTTGDSAVDIYGVSEGGSVAYDIYTNGCGVCSGSIASGERSNTCSGCINGVVLVAVTASTSCGGDSDVSFNIYAKDFSATTLPTGTQTLDMAEERRSYTINLQTESLVLDLNVLTSSGSMELYLVENECDYGCVERVVECFSGHCYIELATYASYQEGVTSYTAIVMGEYGDQFTITATEGTSNCVAPTTAITSDMFCYDTFSSYSSMFNYIDMSVHDTTAEYFYRELVDYFTCPISPLCDQYLKIYACHRSFRECTQSGGFASAMSYDDCSNVLEYCGDFYTQEVDYDDYFWNTRACTDVRYYTTGEGPFESSSDPVNPSDPSNPPTSDPSNPPTSDPSNPPNPSDSSNPPNPSDSSNPTNPSSTSVVESSNPTNSTAQSSNVVESSSSGASIVRVGVAVFAIVAAVVML